MYIEKIVIEEFRCFQHLELEFNYPGKPRGGGPKLDNVTLLLGNNGAGKSAVMKALAWGALAPIMSGAGLTPRFFVRREPSVPATKNASVDAHLVLHTQDFGSAPPLERMVSQGVVQLVHNTETFVSQAVTQSAALLPIYDENSPANFIVGYGSTRRSESSDVYSTEKSRSIRYQRVSSLFEENVALASTALAMQSIERKKRLPEARKILNDLLPEAVQLRDTYDPILGEFQVGGVTVASSDLSDGYRAFTAWTLDLLYNLATVGPPNTALQDLEGVVLLDEIDLHLHPKWQRSVVESAARAFPKLQFIISTHSPLVVGSLESANILVASEDGFKWATEYAEGLSSDQILTSEFFGLDTPRSMSTVEELGALASRAAEGDDEAGLEFLKTLNEGIEPKRSSQS